LEWLAQLDADYENLRHALEWALGKEEAEPSLRLCAALGDFWSFRIYWKEGAQALAQALSKPIQQAKDTERTARVRALYMDAMHADSLDDVERMEHSARSCLALAEFGSNELDTTIARYYVGYTLFRCNLYEEARPLLEQSFKDFRRLGHPYWEAISHCWFGYILFGQGEMRQAEVFARTLELAYKSGERALIAGALRDQGFLYYLQARMEEANQVLDQSRALLSQITPRLDPTIYLRANIAWFTGDIQKAKSLLREHREHMLLLEDKFLLSWTLALLGQLEMEAGNLEQAEIYLREAVAIDQEISNPAGVALGLVQLSILANIQGDTQKFKQTLKESLSPDRELSHLQKMHILTDMLASPSFQKPENSVPILGALDLYYRQMDRPIGPLQKRYYDRAEAAARAALGDAVFESVSAEGAKLSIDEALELMLQKVEKL
jgi:tetratricopeptide (TPR) repeat protein